MKIPSNTDPRSPYAHNKAQPRVNSMFRKKPAVPTVDSGPMDHNGAVASGTAPAPPVNPGAAVPPGFPEVFDLLFKGLPVSER